MTLDLHGLVIHSAWNLFKDQADHAYLDGVKSMKIITGQGQMENEFPIWASNHQYVKSCVKSHPGCFVIKFKNSSAGLSKQN